MTDYRIVDVAAAAAVIKSHFMLQCDCGEDVECQTAKSQIEACRDPVTYATRNDTIVSCTEARWICSADAECGKALEYYHLLCRNMFRGRKCSERCKNSLNILQRQEKAAKLLECQCDPNAELIESFQCSDIKQNMQELCFEPQADLTSTPHPSVTTEETPYPDDVENEVDVDNKIASSGFANGVENWAVIVTIFLMKYTL